jgi:hypothetical protein
MVVCPTLPYQPRVGEDWSVSVSVLLHYPQYDRSDCIQEANEKDLLVEHLAEVGMQYFPHVWMLSMYVFADVSIVRRWL